jgi:hypothetical protein
MPFCSGERGARGQIFFLDLSRVCPRPLFTITIWKKDVQQQERNCKTSAYSWNFRRFYFASTDVNMEVAMGGVLMEDTTRPVKFLNRKKT